jgi:hypothetical protein
MVTKRSLGASLLLLGLAFVGAFHTAAALAFDSGLLPIGIVVTALALLGIVLVNIPADEPDDDEAGADAGPTTDERGE